MTYGTHGTTFGGNPLAMAVGNAVLDIILDEKFLEKVRRTGLLLKQKLAAVADTHPDLIEEIRGEGLMLGIKCRISNGEVVAAARSEGLLLAAAGDNVVRLLPPLIVGEAEVDEAVRACSTRACAGSHAARRRGVTGKPWGRPGTSSISGYR